MGIFLPNKTRCSLKFLQQILTGEKNYVTCDGVRNVIPSQWKELSMKSLMKEIILNDYVYSYFPDFKEGSKQVDRNFFWKVLFHVKPTWAKQLVADAIQQRNEHYGKQVEGTNERIKIKSDLL